MPATALNQAIHISIMRKKSTTAVAMTAITISMLLMTAAQAVAQDGVRYTGKTLSNPNRHDGGLSPVVECITYR